ncbi:MAG: hypothetical protein LBD51_04195 [Bifidobacteriaceae bacterium]|nr:hypothetical protein [Bifidobacteriaceae bacterium]
MALVIGGGVVIGLWPRIKPVPQEHTAAGPADEPNEAPSIPEVPKDGTPAELIWARTLGGADRDGFNAVAVAPDGGLIAAGRSRSHLDDSGPAADLSDDALITKFTPEGELAWAKTAGGTGADGFFAVAAAPDGSLVAAGYTASSDGVFPPTKGEEDAVIARFTAEGELTWAKTLGGEAPDVFTALAVAPDGGFAAVGWTYSPGGDFPPATSHDQADAVIARFTAEGDLVWARALGGAFSDFFEAVALAPDGGFVAAGNTYSSGGGDFPPAKESEYGDALIARFTPEGELTWANTVGGTSDDGFGGVVAASGGGFTAAGWTASSDGDFPPATGEHGLAHYDAVIAQFTAEGVLTWANTLGGEEREHFYGLAAAPGGGFAAVGSAASSDGAFPPAKNAGFDDALIARFTAEGELMWAETLGGADDDAFDAVAVPADGSFNAVGSTLSTDGDLPATKGDADALISRFAGDG